MFLSQEKSANLREEYTKLIAQDHDEQVYQEFIEKNTSLTPRGFILNHGIHLDLLIRKIQLGSDFKPDFMFIAKSSVEWNIVLIEIEKPKSRYFKDGSNELHADFSKALQQISTWRAWFDNAANKASFIDGTLGQIRVPAPMRSHPCHIKYILVHGRRSEFDGNDHRKGLIRAYERADDFQIMSFDSLAESIETKNVLYLGVKKNTHLEIITTEFITESIFVWIEPTFIKIKEALRTSILANKAAWWSRSSIAGGFKTEENLKKITSY